MPHEQDSIHNKVFLQPDWYFENGMPFYTAASHLRRGYCCGSG